MSTAPGDYLRFAQLGTAVRAWEVLKSASATEVRDLFERTERGLWTYADPRLSNATIGWQVGDYDHADFRVFLAIQLQDETNSYLSGSCSPALIRQPNNLSFQIKMVPHDLVGFMWVQFAEAVVGGKDFRQCASCAAWMEIAPGHGRPEKSYCSNACRMRAYRRRKEKRDQRRK
jgi:hypothetical protein